MSRQIEPGPTPDAPPRPLRSDAARNHQVVLAAARSLYAERGLGVSLEEIARVAGVGIGTLYRRFPDRHALLSALFDERFEAVNELAQQALETDDAWSGLEHFITESVAMFSDDRGLREIAFDPTEQYAALITQRDRLAKLLARVTDRAHRAGVLRSECRPEDLGSIIAMLSRVEVHAPGGGGWASAGAAARCTAFVLDGIKAR